MKSIRFNGKKELRTPPRLLSGVEIFQQVKYINITFGHCVDNQLIGKGKHGASTSRDRS